MNIGDSKESQSQFNIPNAEFMVKIPNGLIDDKANPHYLLYLFTMLRLYTRDSNNYSILISEVINYIQCDIRSIKTYLPMLRQLGYIDYKNVSISPKLMLNINFTEKCIVGGYTEVDSYTVVKIIEACSKIKVTTEGKIKDSKEIALRLFYLIVKKRLKDSKICRISYETISAHTGINRNSISEVINCFENNGLFKVSHGKCRLKNEKVKNESNEYVPVFKRII